MNKYTSIILSAILLLSSCGRKFDETQPQTKDLSEFVFASGSLQSDGQYNLTAETDGYLTKMDFKEGDIVAKNQILASIDNDQNVYNAKGASALHNIALNNAQSSAPALQQIQANIQSAKAQLQLDQQQEERYKILYASNSVSLLEYQNVQLAVTNAKQTLQSLHDQYNNQLVNARQQEVTQRVSKDINAVIKSQNNVRAVTAGRIYQKLKQTGDYVRKGDIIATIGNPNLIYAFLSLDESNMGKIKTGQQVFIQLNTDKHKNYTAVIHEILPSFDVNSQSFNVKAYFTDSLDFKIVNTQLEANILTGEKKNALVIPRSYLSYDNTVMLKKDKKSIPVKTGILSNDWAEIVSGLGKQDIIIQYKN